MCANDSADCGRLPHNPLSSRRRTGSVQVERERVFTLTRSINDHLSRLNSGPASHALRLPRDQRRGLVEGYGVVREQGVDHRVVGARHGQRIAGAEAVVDDHARQ